MDGKDMHIDFQTITKMAINGKDTSVRRLLSYVNENRAHFYIGLYYYSLTDYKQAIQFLNSYLNSYTNLTSEMRNKAVKLLNEAV